MSFLFSRSKQKSPQELVKTLKDQLARTDTDKRRTEDVPRLLAQIKLVLYGDNENDPSPDQIAILSQDIYSSDLLVPLSSNLHAMDFEARKDTVAIFSTLLKRQIGTRSPTVDYLLKWPQIFDSLILATGNYDSALSASQILRECARYEELNALIVNSAQIWNLFDYVIQYPFEISTDIFNTLSSLLTTHEVVAATFVMANYNKFIHNMNNLFLIDNYVTRRQSLKLLASMLRSRKHYNFLTTYVSELDNLKIIMQLLPSKSKNIQYESFQIFRLFVANPKKPRTIVEILVKNRQRLLSLLNTLDSINGRQDEQDFASERQFVIQCIVDLQLPSASRETSVSSLPKTEVSSSRSSSRPVSKAASPSPPNTVTTPSSPRQEAH